MFTDSWGSYITDAYRQAGMELYNAPMHTITGASSGSGGGTTLGSGSSGGGSSSGSVWPEAQALAGEGAAIREGLLAEAQMWQDLGGQAPGGIPWNSYLYLQELPVGILAWVEKELGKSGLQARLLRSYLGAIGISGTAFRARVLGGGNVGSRLSSLAKWGGIGVGTAVVGIDSWNQYQNYDSGERAGHTLARTAFALGGGAAGVALGTLCGPGAFVCIPIFAAGGAYAGTSLYDQVVSTDPKPEWYVDARQYQSAHSPYGGGGHGYQTGFDRPSMRLDGDTYRENNLIISYLYESGMGNIYAVELGWG